MGRVNTQMDIQRKYVWTSDREQEMWDTLLLNVRIPEFHCILQGRIRNICDGKQRLTCIFKILRNQIPYKRSTAKKECLWLFEYVANKNKKNSLPYSIYFKDLPGEIQDNIATKTLNIVRYFNLTREEEIMLFRKINNGMALSEFARGMASYYYMRKDFTQVLMDDSNLKDVINANIVNDEHLETILIRALILCTHDNSVNLQPNNLESFYEEYKDERIIKKWANNFCQLLDRFPNIKIAFSGRSCRSILPFALESVYRHPELTSEQIATLCKRIASYSSGRGSDMGSNRVTRVRNEVEELINKIKYE